MQASGKRFGQMDDALMARPRFELLGHLMAAQTFEASKGYVLHDRRCALRGIGGGAAKLWRTLHAFPKPK